MILKNKTQLFAASKWLISALKKNVDSKWGDKICDSKQMAVRTKQAKYVLLLLFTQSCPALQSHGLQHVRLLCPLPSPRVCSDCCLFSLWCYLTISSSATPVSFCLHSFLASRSFPMKGLFPSGGQSLYVKWSEVAQSCLTLCDPWTVAHQAPQSMAFSRQEYWSGLPFPSPGIFPTQDQTWVSHIASRRFTVWAPFLWGGEQEYCSGLPFPSPEDLPSPGTEPGSPAL